MSDAEFRDDGTVICQVHGLRYDPALTEGCIRCPKSVAPGKRSLPPKRSVAPSAAPRSNRPIEGYAPIRLDLDLPPPAVRPPSAPPLIPYDPGEASAAMYPTQQGPKITLLAGPKMRSSRRGLIALVGLVVLGGAAGAAWVLGPDAAVDWSKRVTPFRYGPSAARVGSLFVPTVAAETPCPLLLLLDPLQHGAQICTRFARRCEQFGWAAVSSDSLGGSATPDAAEVAELLDYARANANVSAARAVVAGFDVAADAACRLALVDPDTFAGAILECGSLRAWRDVGALARADERFFLFTREKDANREAMTIMKDEMLRKGLRVETSEIAGGHAPMERDELDPAFAWLESLKG